MTGVVNKSTSNIEINQMYEVPNIENASSSKRNVNDYSMANTNQKKK